MYDWGDRSLPVTARLRSRFFINIGGPQGHATPLKIMYDWGDRSLPVTARLRSRFFINIGRRRAMPPEQKLNWRKIASYAGAGAAHIVKQAALRLLEEQARFHSAVRKGELTTVGLCLLCGTKALDGRLNSLKHSCHFV